MAGDHLSSLQDVVQLIIGRELSWSERQFRRVTMSHDSNNNPAELYGADGKIYYRKAGGAGAEIGISGGGLWVSGGTPEVTSLATPEDIDMQSTTVTGYDILNCGGIELSDGTISSPRLNFNVPLDSGYSGVYVNVSNSPDYRLELKDRETHVVIGAISAAAGLVLATKIVMSGCNVEGVGTLKAHGANSLMFHDDNTGTKTLAQLATGGGLWSSDATDVWLTTTKDIDLKTKCLVEVNEIHASQANGIIIREEDGVTVSCYLGNNIASPYSFIAAKPVALSGNNILMDAGSITGVGGITMNNATSPIVMTGSQITGLGAAAANGDAVRWEQLINIAGTNNTAFTIDQDKTAAGVNTTLRFNRGSTAGDARLLWDETNDRFELDDVAGVTCAKLRIAAIYMSGALIFDDTTGKVKIEENDTSHDMEFTVKTGDAFVFKTVT